MKRFVASICIIFSLIYATIFIPGAIEYAIKCVAEVVLSDKSLSTKITKVQLSENTILLHDIHSHYNNQELCSVDNVMVNYDIKRSIQKLALIFDIKLLNLRMQELSLNAEGSIAYAASYLKLHNGKITIPNLRLRGGHKKSLTGDSIRNIAATATSGSLDISGSYKTKLGRPHALVVTANATHIPVMLHKALWHVLPDNDVVGFLKDFILAGEVSGSIDIALDKDFFIYRDIKPSSFVGRFTLHDVDLKYDNYFPAVQNINADATLAGAKLNFAITQGYSGHIKLYDGIVLLDCDKGQETEVMIHTKGKGPVVDLISFIPESSLDKLKKSKVDLSKITGNVDVDFSMQIPLQKDISNKYDVKAEISNMHLKILDDNVELSQSKLHGIFNGDIITLDGTGKVNDFNSILHYKMNFDSKEAFDHNMHIQLQLMPLEGRQHEVLSILQGKTIIDIDYVLKGQNSSLGINSNLKNVEFSVDKLGLHKPLGKKASLKIEGHASDMAPSHLDIKVLGEDGMKIIGFLEIKDNEKKLHFTEIKHIDTSIKADFTFDNAGLKAKIYGGQMDLSSTNMMRYLDKDTDDGNIDLRVDLNKIKLKNNIWLDDFVMRIRCDKSKCYEGIMNSNIGSKSFRMDLHNTDNIETWEITSTNAGAILMALGLYDKIKAGNLLVTIDASRKEIKAGEPISVINGRFEIKKFVTVDAPFLTRMISFISLPGLLSAITDNKNISFADFNGAFNYKDEVIKITDASAEGAFFNFTMYGSIDTKKRQVSLNGSVIPSLYGISGLLRKIPILGTLLSGGHRKGLIFAPYFMKHSY